MRAYWKGSLQFLRFDIQVEIVSASHREDIAFQLLHAPCRSPLSTEKRCPEHGRVADGEITRGYEIDQGEYVLLAEEEFEKIRLEADPHLRISEFVERGRIDPIHFRKSYLLAPAAENCHDYVVFRESIRRTNTFAVGKVAMPKREHLFAVWARDSLLYISLLHYPHELARPGDLPGLDVQPQSLDSAIVQAEALVREHTNPLRIEQFEDTYRERLISVLSQKIVQAEGNGEFALPVPEIGQSASAAEDGSLLPRPMQKSPPADQQGQRRAG